MLGILVPIGLLFFVLELVRPARPQLLFRRGLLADVFYVPVSSAGALTDTRAAAAAHAVRDALTG